MIDELVRLERGQILQAFLEIARHARSDIGTLLGQHLCGYLVERLRRVVLLVAQRQFQRLAKNFLRLTLYDQVFK